MPTDLVDKAIIAVMVLGLGQSCRLYWRDYTKYRARCTLEAQIQREGREKEIYPYQPLAGLASKTLRLIELLPEENGALIPHINLHHRSLLDPGVSYEALSYCWGDAKQLWPVLYISEGTIIWVTRNLFDALLRLRQPGQSRLIWADAICINQQNITERNWSVRLMGDIYTRASKVLVWLGEAKDDSELVEPFVTKLLEIDSRLEKEGLRDTNLDELSPQTRQELGIPKGIRIGGNPPREAWAMVAITERAWWRRVWIIQEFLLADDVLLICGDWSIPWASFSTAFTMAEELNLTVFGNKPTAYMSQFQLLREHRNNNCWRDKRLPLLGLLYWNRAAQASDPRDHIYALLSLADDGDEIEVDYSKLVESVFEEATRQMVLKKPLNLLPIATSGISGALDTSWPSWVRKWHIPRGDVDLWMGGLHAANATLGSEPDILCKQTSIRLAGYPLDTVVQVGLHGPSFPYTPQYLIWKAFEVHIAISSWANVCNIYRTQLYSPTGEDIKDAFWQTFMAPSSESTYDQQKDKFNSLEPEIRIIRWVLLLPLPYNWILCRVLAILISSIPLIPETFRQLARGTTNNHPHLLSDFLRCFGRRMARTERGFIGLVPQEAKPGDQIFLVKGMDYPFVLRKAIGREGYYLVGQSIVHRVMNGECWSLEKCQSIDLV